MGTSTCKNTSSIDQTNLQELNCRNMLGLKQSDIVIEADALEQSKNDQPIQFSDYQSPRDRSIIEKKDYNFENSTSEIQRRLSKSVSHSKRDSTVINQIGQCVMVSRVRNNQMKISGYENYQPISVSFSVVMLTVPKQIKQQLLRKHNKFIETHSNPDSHTFRGWKLQKEGFYSNLCTNDQRVFMISDEEFYWGKVKMKTFVPDKNGLLINRIGAYQGMFREGRADGKGKYSWNHARVVEFDGLWDSGNPVSGNLTGLNFIYQGQLSNGIPNGYGVLSLKSPKGQIKYEGKFKEGKYHDTDATYTTMQYIYKGGFKQGRKNGEGEYVERKSKKKNSGAMGSSKQLKGIWRDDAYIQLK